MILWSIYWVEVFTVWLFSLWLSLLSELFIFPQRIRGLLVGLDFPPSGRLVEPGLSWDYKDVLGTLLGMNRELELARRRLQLSSTSCSSPVCWWLMRRVCEVPEVVNESLWSGGVLLWMSLPVLYDSLTTLRSVLYKCWNLPMLEMRFEFQSLRPLNITINRTADITC